MKGISLDTTPILGSSAGYREKRSHNRMTDSHWVLKHVKHIALKYIWRQLLYWTQSTATTSWLY